MIGKKRKGAALIVVLLLAATLSLVAFSIAETTSRSAERASGLRVRNESIWLALGVEQLTLAAVKAGTAAAPRRLTGVEPWIGKPLTLPLEGGSARVVIVDATRCINLNSLVESRAGGRVESSKAGAAMFTALVAAVRPEGVASESALAAAVTDWIDPDAFSEPQGAEDGAYLSQRVPHRTGGTPFSDVTELRAVRGMSAAGLLELRRMVCAVPGPSQLQINVNMLRPEDAPLLIAVTEGAVSAAEADAVIADRPPGGYETAAAFWDHPVFSQKKLGENVRGRAATTSRFLEAQAAVNHGGQTLDLTLLIEVSQSGKARVVRRRLGSVE